MFLDVDGSTALATAVFPTGPRSCRLVTEYLFSPEAFEDPEFDPTPVDRVQRAGHAAGQRGLRARAARGHLTRVRPRRLPGEGRLGARASTSATCATSRPDRARRVRRARRGRAPRRASASTGLTSSSASSGWAAATRGDPGHEVRERVEVDRRATPGSVSSSGAPRRDEQQRPRAARAETGASASAVSPSTSAKTPPSPTMSTGPKRGSRTQPTISSTPASRSAIASTETAGGARRATRSSVRRPAAAASGSPRTTPPPSDLCSRRSP